MFEVGDWIEHKGLKHIYEVLNIYGDSVIVQTVRAWDRDKKTHYELNIYTQESPSTLHYDVITKNFKSANTYRILYGK